MKNEMIKVLLIEDDEDDYVLTRDLLSEVRNGEYSLDWAPSYAEGLKIARCGEHHVCLVDYRLGELSGVQLIREAREFGLTTPMILLTGQGNHDIDVEAIEAGATDYLVKDETPAGRLERTIRYAVELNAERCRVEEELTERKRIEVELEQARDAALESVRLKSEFLANMSHEIRTPMNVIIGTAELAMATHLDDRQHRYLNSIASAADSLLTIINDILDFSKIDAGMLSFETIDFDLHSKVESVMQLMAERVHAKGLDLSLIWNSDVPTKLRGDPTRLHQILTNLMGNAIKFTEQGKVTITVSKESEEEERVTIRCDIKDTGIGISENDQKMLFAPFRQADGSVTRRYGGTGLGLAIAKQLVEMMDGAISVNSEPGCGSTFSFTATLIKQANQEPSNPPINQPSDLNLNDIPRFEYGIPTVPFPKSVGSSDTTKTAEPTAGETAGLTRNILLVEDNEVNQMVAGDQLASLGYRVDLASNGQKALDALALKSYDVVLMDCGMPVMDGYTATAEIRKREGASVHTPIIAMTAHAMNGDEEKCLASGMDFYIAKPVKRKTLEEIFANVFAATKPSLHQLFPADPEAIAARAQSAIVDVVCLADIASTPAKLKHMIGFYLHHTEERLEELDTAVKQNWATDVYAVAHKCLGSSSTFGMTAIVPSLTELQRMGRGGDLQGADEQIAAAHEAFQKLKQYLEIYCEQLPVEEDCNE
ncbi:MAG: two-component system, sensor histidine kinase and response regulator [Blastocatellia bacterium]|jgi:signal transduction histidine kinase/HPt (histidine-containing phosphotransfer) domain-containing protein|nr:two-component system, sensor histidine kinase and response regulator [Blastocatellia bacterium]